jgi:hypothetical protein
VTRGEGGGETPHRAGELPARTGPPVTASKAIRAQRDGFNASIPFPEKGPTANRRKRKGAD